MTTDQRRILADMLTDSSIVIRTIEYPSGLDLPKFRLDCLKVVYTVSVGTFADWYGIDGRLASTRELSVT